MSDKNQSFLWPLVSTILGGILAIWGGVIAARSTSSAELSLDRERYERERLEKAYLLLLEADDWVNLEMHKAASDGSWQKPEGAKDTTKEAIMLVRLYAPELGTETEKLANARRAFTSALFTYWQALGLPREQPSRKAKPADLSKRGIDELRTAKIASEVFKQKVGEVLEGLEACVHKRMGVETTHPFSVVRYTSTTHRDGG